MASLGDESYFSFPGHASREGEVEGRGCVDDAEAVGSLDPHAVSLSDLDQPLLEDGPLVADLLESR